MAKQDGTVIVLKIGSSIFTGLTSNDLAYAVDTIDTTTKDSNGHKEYIAGEDGGTINFDSLYDPSGTYSLAEVFAAAKAKALVTVTMGNTTAGSEYVTASAVINSVNWGAPKSGASTVGGSLQLSGEITMGTVTDATAPLLESAYVNNATPTILRIKFNEKLDPAYIVAGTAWSADGSSSGAKTVSSTTISDDKIYLTMDEAYVSGDTITVTYTKPGGAQDIRDKSGNQVATFGPEAVTNNIS